MENFFLILIGLLLVVLIQGLVYIIYQKTQRLFLAILPNLGLLMIGLMIGFIGFIVAWFESGSWAGFGATIIFLLVLIATFISTITSMLLIYLIKQIKKKQ
jgi:hypothetical protein